MSREYIGLDDKNGTKIYVGDIVRFYYDCYLGPSIENTCGRYTEMIDIVIRHDEKAYVIDVNTGGIIGEKMIPTYYFLCEEIGSAAYACRYNDYCEVIGSKDISNIITGERSCE